MHHILSNEEWGSFRELLYHVERLDDFLNCDLDNEAIYDRLKDKVRFVQVVEYIRQILYHHSEFKSLINSRGASWPSL
jgi:hypothetical protein